MTRLHVVLALLAIDCGTSFFSSLTCERCVSPRIFLSLGTTLFAMRGVATPEFCPSSRLLSIHQVWVYDLHTYILTPLQRTSSISHQPPVAVNKSSPYLRSTDSNRGTATSWTFPAIPLFMLPSCIYCILLFISARLRIFIHCCFTSLSSGHQTSLPTEMHHLRHTPATETSFHRPLTR